MKPRKSKGRQRKMSERQETKKKMRQNTQRSKARESKGCQGNKRTNKDAEGKSEKAKE